MSTTSRRAATIGWVTSVSMTLVALAAGVYVGSEIVLPHDVWAGLACATVVPAVFSALVAVPVGQAVYRRLAGSSRHNGTGRSR